MANYIFLNVQVLPQKVTSPEIGSDGYKKILKALDERRKASVLRKTLHVDSYRMKSGMFLNFFSLHFMEKGRVFGEIIKFDQPDAIYDTYSGDKVQEIAVGLSSKRNLYKFLFDLDKHIVAVESPAGLSAKQIKNIFIHYFYDVAKEIYPNYLLTVDIIINNNSIERVMRDAEYFKSIRVEITYSNQTAFERKLFNKDQELKEKGITKRIVEESANEAGGEITEPTEDMQIALSLAKRLGDATIRYKNSVSKRIEKFQFSLNPFKKNIRKISRDSEPVFRDRIEEAINDAAQQANSEIRR